MKLLFDGLLADETKSMMFIAKTSKLISVKTRKGQTGWSRSSGIPRTHGDDIPTHLAFVHLFENYALDRIWLFPWKDLIENNRFRKKVRGNQLDYYFVLDERNDLKCVVYKS